MEKDQNLLRLGPGIRLLRRHMQEWKSLMGHQEQVRLLTKHHIEQQANNPTASGEIASQQVIDQRYRLNRVLRRQFEECRQLRARHQQEELALEQTINTHSLEN